jgi:hypothetical protein
MPVSLGFGLDDHGLADWPGGLGPGVMGDGMAEGHGAGVPVDAGEPLACHARRDDRTAVATAYRFGQHFVFLTVEYCSNAPGDW